MIHEVTRNSTMKDCVSRHFVWLGGSGRCHQAEWHLPGTRLKAARHSTERA